MRLMSFGRRFGMKIVANSVPEGPSLCQTGYRGVSGVSRWLCRSHNSGFGGIEPPADQTLPVRLWNNKPSLPGLHPVGAGKAIFALAISTEAATITKTKSVEGLDSTAGVARAEVMRTAMAITKDRKTSIIDQYRRESVRYGFTRSASRAAHSSHQRADRAYAGAQKRPRQPARPLDDGQ